MGSSTASKGTSSCSSPSEAPCLSIPSTNTSRHHSCDCDDDEEELCLVLMVFQIPRKRLTDCASGAPAWAALGPPVRLWTWTTKNLDPTIQHGCLRPSLRHRAPLEEISKNRQMRTLALNQGIWQCLCNILQIDPTQAQTVKDIASLPLVLGGLGLRSARRTRVPAHWQVGQRLHSDDSSKTPHSGRAVGATIGGTSCDHLLARSSVGCPFLGRHVGMDSTVLESPSKWGAIRHATARGIRAWHATRGLATRSGIPGGTTLQRCRFVSKVERSRGGACVITSRTWFRACTRHVPDVSHHVTGAPTLPGAPPPSLAPPSSLVLALLAVWPTTRPMWPPPGSLRAGWGPGEAQVLFGDRRSSHLPRGWCQGDHKHSRP